MFKCGQDRNLDRVDTGAPIGNLAHPGVHEARQLLAGAPRPRRHRRPSRCPKISTVARTVVIDAPFQPQYTALGDEVSGPREVDATRSPTAGHRPFPFRSTRGGYSGRGAHQSSGTSMPCDRWRGVTRHPTPRSQANSRQPCGTRGSSRAARTPLRERDGNGTGTAIGALLRRLEGAVEHAEHLLEPLGQLLPLGLQLGDLLVQLAAATAAPRAPPPGPRARRPGRSPSGGPRRTPRSSTRASSAPIPSSCGLLWFSRVVTRTSPRAARPAVSRSRA